jgi:uncharacterized YccA/Bax inhibitor family protein
MPTSNPALNEKIFSREIEEARAKGHSSQALSEPGGWAAPGGPQAARPAPPTAPPAAPSGITSGFAGQPAPVHQPGAIPPAPDTVSAWPPPPSVLGYEPMRVGGVASATAVLGVVLLVAAFFGWHSVGITTGTNLAGEKVVTDMNLPGWLWPALIGGFIIAMVTIWKPKIARVTAPLYAFAEGLFLGAISKVFNVQYSGIVLQAVELTGAVFVIMLVLFASGAIRVTNKLRTGIMVALGGVFGVYVLSFVLSLFGVHNPMIYSAGPVGVAFSLLVVGVAAFMLLLDFDFVRQAVAARAPRYMEWYAAFSLMITLIWLYLELLRLLAKLRN